MKFQQVKCLHIHSDYYQVTINDVKIECEKSDLRLIIQTLDNEII